MPKSGIAGSYGNSSFWAASIQFSTVGIPIYIPTNRVGEFPFLHTLFSIYLQTFSWWLLWLVWTGILLCFNLHFSSN